MQAGRKKKPARLYLRRNQTPAIWYINDKGRAFSTGFVEEKVREAEKALAEYIESRRENTANGNNIASEIIIGDILAYYVDNKLPLLKNKKAEISFISNINNFWGNRVVSDIKTSTCREYGSFRHSASPSTVKRELESLRAAVNFYHKENPLEALPIVTLPNAAPARERWLTRREIASLIKAARSKAHPQHIQAIRAHMVRFIMIGFYTGTRHEAILNLFWERTPSGGYIDFDNGIIYRKGFNEVETSKRRPPIKIHYRLMRFLKYWKDNDWNIPYVIHDEKGVKINHQIRKAWLSICEEAGLGRDVVPHTLRHTNATLRIMSGKETHFDIAQSLGMSISIFEKRYAHYAPSFQSGVSNSSMGKRKMK
jgi:integrase